MPLPTQHFAASDLTIWAAAAFRGGGLDETDAHITAQTLVRTNLRGIDTHGVSRIPDYVRKIRVGEVNAHAQPTLTEREGVLYFDGDRAIGQATATNAMTAAIDAARSTSVVSCVLRNTRHFGALGMFTLAAAEAGMVALLCQEAVPLMALPGSSGRAIGNSPIAFSAAVKNRAPLVFDIATSHVARGNVAAAAREGVPIPDDWAIDANGEPTTDAETAMRGSMLPMAGHKGIGLAMMIQVLAGSLGDSALHGAAAGSAESAAGDTGAFLLVINPERMLGRDRFEAHMSGWLDNYLEASGPEARYPGERAARTEGERLRAGIPLTATVLEELRLIGSEVGVPFELDPVTA